MAPSLADFAYELEFRRGGGIPSAPSYQQALAYVRARVPTMGEYDPLDVIDAQEFVRREVIAQGPYRWVGFETLEALYPAPGTPGPGPTIPGTWPPIEPLPPPAPRPPGGAFAWILAGALLFLLVRGVFGGARRAA